MKKILFSSFWLLLFLQQTAQAQREMANWRFGIQAGLVFPAVGAPAPAAGSSLVTYEACSSVSDAAGNLLCYTNAVQVWDRTNAPMPNGGLRWSNISASQGALLVPRPGSANQFYLFTIDSAEDNLVGGLRYSIVDMTLRSGLGDIGPTKEIAVPVPGNSPLSEKLTAIRHANGRDYWVLVHGFGTGPGASTFYCYLLTAAGLSTTPVVSTLGTIHTGGGLVNGYPLGNSVGYIRASPDGQHLAVSIRQTLVEVFDFSPATGQVSGWRPVALSSPYYYGLEFSPNGQKLYISDLTGSSIWQVDMGSASLSAQYVSTATSYTGAILRGPDGILYVAVDRSNYLAAITNPNGTPATCGFVDRGAYLGAGQSRVGLPNFPAISPLVLAVSAPLRTCVGERIVVSGLTGTVPPGSIFSWNFGDPGAGNANTATGVNAAHIYANSGSFTIALTLTTPTASRTVQQAIIVNAAPTFSLGARIQTICPGTAVTLGTTALPAGTTYRWQNGSTASTIVATAPGRYRLEATSPQGCRARDSVSVLLSPKPVVNIGPDTTLCAEAASVTLQVNPQPIGSTYRWQDGSVATQYVAQAAGIYWVEVRNVAGCAARDSVVVKGRICRPVFIPNIITPNGDPLNQTFFLQGLTVADWAIRIYSRWGREVWQQTSYDNAWAATGQPDGLYYYLLTNAATGQRYRGWVEVVR